MREGYKKTELGEIPVDWEVKKLEEFSISSSYGPRFSAELYDESGNCRVIRGTDVIANGKVDYAGIPCASISNEVLEKHRLIENDFVVITTADCGVSFVFDTSGVFMPSAYMVRIRFNDKISPYFVNKFFYTKIIKRQVEKYIRKGTVANLPGSDLLKFKICIPPLSEQKKIADILSIVDIQIDQTDKLIEKTKELKKGLMQKLLTKGIGHTEFKKTEVGEIPVEWEVRKLSKHVELKHGYQFRKEDFCDKGIPIIKISQIGSNGRMDLSELSYIEYGRQREFEDIIIQNGDILMALSGATVGKVAIVENIDGVYLQNYRVGKMVSDFKIASRFLYYFIYSELFFNQLIKLTNTSAQPNFGKQDMDKIIITIPPLEEQEQIANILSSVDEKIQQYETKKEKLQELKKGLMHKLLTGNIRVKV